MQIGNAPLIAVAGIVIEAALDTMPLARPDPR
jgi:hypothetical protein